jgi:hydroxyacylglutathione hydrolase
MSAMIFKRIYDDKLAQASYLIGCSATGEAIVVDPNRDVDQYVRAAEVEGLRITHVTETHIHADFVSGALELADRTGARLYLSDEGDAEWKYRYAGARDAVLLKDGMTVHVGNIVLRVMHSPGHTPEHISFLVMDGAASDEPMGILTGDFVFVGDVGRPDLLERAAGHRGTMEAGARTLFRSLQRFRALPVHLQVWPGHGAGSACGKALGAVPQSTVGYELLVNWAFQYHDEDAFVSAVLAGQPEPPAYFAQMKRINKEGPAILHDVAQSRLFQETKLPVLLREGALIIDTRRAAEYAAGHVPGTLNIPLTRSFNTWAGWLIPYDREFYLIIDEAGGPIIDVAVKDLAMIGLDRVAGYFDADSIAVWAADMHELATIPQIRSRELASRLAAGTAMVIDVRGDAEWRAGHLPGSINIPVGHLVDRLSEIPRDRTIVLQCQSGARSSIAASVLRLHGVHDVMNLAGGMLEWTAAGQPIEKGETADLVAARA